MSNDARRNRTPPEAEVVGRPALMQPPDDPDNPVPWFFPDLGVFSIFFVLLFVVALLVRSSAGARSPERLRVTPFEIQKPEWGEPVRWERVRAITSDYDREKRRFNALVLTVATSEGRSLPGAARKVPITVDLRPFTNDTELVRAIVEAVYLGNPDVPLDDDILSTVGPPPYGIFVAAKALPEDDVEAARLVAIALELDGRLDKANRLRRALTYGLDEDEVARAVYYEVNHRNLRADSLPEDARRELRRLRHDLPRHFASRRRQVRAVS